MRAMILERPGAPLRLVELPVSRPRRGEVLIEVEACGVCPTDLHLVDGEFQSTAVLTMDGQQPYTQPVGFGIPA